jgi:hypothetical protein
MPAGSAPGAGPAAPGGDSPEAILDREIANTQRSTATMAASAGSAICGALHIAGALQIWSLLRLPGMYKLVPWLMVALGAAFIALGSRIYRQDLRAVIGAIALGSFDVIAMGVWVLLSVGSGFFSMLMMLLPMASVATAVLGGLAYGSCLRTAEARRRAKAAGFDLDL